MSHIWVRSLKRVSLLFARPSSHISMRLLFIENFNRWWTASSAGVSTLLNYAIYSVSGHQKFARKFGASRRRELELLSLGWNKLQLAVLEPTSEKAAGPSLVRSKEKAAIVRHWFGYPNVTQPTSTQADFFSDIFFLGQAVQSLSFFFALFQKQPRTHNSTTCCNCPPQVLRALYEHKGKENDCHIWA